MTQVAEREILTSKALRNAFAKFPSGVVAVCAHDGSEPVGMAVSAFMPVSLDPPMLSVCIQKSSTTWPRLRECGVVGVSVLSRDQREEALRLASKDADRFVGVNTIALGSPALVVEGAHAWFECVIDTTHDAGDHVIVVLRIRELFVDHDAEDPMIFFGSGFRGLRHRGWSGSDLDHAFDPPIPTTKRRL